MALDPPHDFYRCQHSVESTMGLVPKSRIAELREKTGLTQAQLAVLVGVTTNTIQNWEKADGLNQLERYFKLAIVLQCELFDLVKYVEADEDTQHLSKGFSLEDLRELRERWGTAAKAAKLPATSHEKVSSGETNKL